MSFCLKVWYAVENLRTLKDCFPSHNLVCRPNFFLSFELVLTCSSRKQLEKLSFLAVLCEFEVHSAVVLVSKQCRIIGL